MVHKKKETWWSVKQHLIHYKTIKAGTKKEAIQKFFEPVESGEYEEVKITAKKLKSSH